MLESYLLDEKRLIIKQVEELFRGGYINAGEAQALITKHTDVLRVEVSRV